jgi:hypothetical protein
LVSATVGDASLLDDTVAWLERFVGANDGDDLALIALWIIHTHVPEECYTTPRLLLNSPVPESGKTTCLMHIKALGRDAVLMSSVTSAALLARLINGSPKTLLIDEADRALDRSNKNSAEILATLNSGYKRGATRPVLDPSPDGGWVPSEMETFAPVAMAGNSPNLPPDTASRTIEVMLMPSTSVEESEWEFIESDAQQLKERIERWAESHRAAVRDSNPEMPHEVRNRAKEKWKPLARVAEQFGEEWLERTKEMAKADVEQAKRDREDGASVEKPHIILVRHIAEVWPDGQQFVSTNDLVLKLTRYSPEDWGVTSFYGKALTIQRMGRMLSQKFKINSARESDGSRGRGYRLKGFERVWKALAIDRPIWMAVDGEFDPMLAEGLDLDVQAELGRTGIETDPSSTGASCTLSGGRGASNAVSDTCTHRLDQLDIHPSWRLDGQPDKCSRCGEDLDGPGLNSCRDGRHERVADMVFDAL